MYGCWEPYGDVCDRCRLLYWNAIKLVSFTLVRNLIYDVQRRIPSINDVYVSRLASLLFSMTLCMLRKVRHQVFITTFPSRVSWFIVRAIVCAECKLHVDISKMEYRHKRTFIVFWKDAVYMLYTCEKKLCGETAYYISFQIRIFVYIRYIFKNILIYYCTFIYISIFIIYIFLIIINYLYNYRLL